MPRAPLLRARLNSDIVSTDPGTRRDENTDGVLLHIVEGLVASREDGSVGPMLASRWSISADGRIYTFALRPEVVFHNGAPLTSAEVVWSLQRYLKPETRWRCLDVFGPKGIARVVSVKRTGSPYRASHARPGGADVSDHVGQGRLRRHGDRASGLRGAGWKLDRADRHGAVPAGGVASQPVRAAQTFPALCLATRAARRQYRRQACVGRCSFDF